MDSLCSEGPVTTLVLLKDVLLSASAASPCIHLWALTYDARHKPAAHAPSGSAHTAITRDADRTFYVRHRNQMEVFSWNNHKGEVLLSTEAWKRFHVFGLCAKLGVLSPLG